MNSDPKTKQALIGRRNRSVAVYCAVFVSVMVGAAYAAVPLYELFCRVTGYGGTVQVADGLPDRPIDRRITVRFDGNVSGGLPWEFDSKRREVTLNVGEAGAMNYVAKNTGKAPSWGTSTFNVTPFEAGAYFNKIDCFCFTEQQLKAGERLEMPVVFFIDPEIDNDPDLKSLKTITLSYTFFPADPPEQPVATIGENSVEDNPKL